MINRPNFSECFSKLIYVLLFITSLQACQKQKSFQVEQKNDSVTVNTDNYRLIIQKAGFKYTIENADGKVIAPAHPVSGIQIGEKNQALQNIRQGELTENNDESLVFDAETESGISAIITVWPGKQTIRMQVKPKKDGTYAIMGRTQGVQPAYGLGDHAAFGNHEHYSGIRPKVELTGFESDTLRGYRMISNFAIFPQQGLAEVNIEPGDKRVGFTKDENIQGSENVRSMPLLYYFVGSPKEIYQAFLKVRNEKGYPVYKPKYEWFGVGWEAFGALAWNTNQKTVTNNVNKYLDLGYPLKWLVLGSGFWPRGEGSMDKHGTPYNAETKSIDAKKLEATTSFGLWDNKLYPTPRKMIDHFHDEGLLFTIGLRNGFIPGGPFTSEGLENHYFMKDENGKARLFKVGFPRSKVYLLDSQNPEAVEWYRNLCQKWMDYGVDGFKEDIFGYPQWLRDDMLNPVNEALMDDSVYIMGRNNYLGAPFDIARYNDFNYNQPQDRGPINGLAYAYSGFSNVYPDIVGGTGLTTGRFGDENRNKLKTYLMRESMYAALNPSMSYGYGPWNFDQETNHICLKAARLHNQLQPYFYSNAIKAYQTGYPYPLTPLPLAYPDDQKVYGLADTTRRSYEWMIGESLLATPLYGDDYATADSRDIYLPAGKWMDYETGKVYEGPTTLTNFALPVDKVPLFVGGKGIVVLQKDGQLFARVYPVTAQSEITFYDKDGKTKSTISIAQPDWKDVSVTDGTNSQTVTGQWTNHAYEFPITPGHNYRVK